MENKTYAPKKELTNKEIEKLIRVFRGWQFGNLEIFYGKVEKSVIDTFGLPYTSSGDYAGIWNTNTESVYIKDQTFKFEGCTIAESGEFLAIFTPLDSNGNELETVFIEMKQIIRIKTLFYEVKNGRNF